METTKGLSNLQLELLKIYSFNISDERLLELKALLAIFFADKLTNDFDTLCEEKGWGEEKIEELKNEHMRIKYKVLVKN